MSGKNDEMRQNCLSGNAVAAAGRMYVGWRDFAAVTRSGVSNREVLSRLREYDITAVSACSVVYHQLMF